MNPWKQIHSLGHIDIVSQDHKKSSGILARIPIRNGVRSADHAALMCAAPMLRSALLSMMNLAQDIDSPEYQFALEALDLAGEFKEES